MATAPEAIAAPPPRIGRRAFRLAQVGGGVLLFALVAVAAAREWGDVRDTLARISPLQLLSAELLAFVGLAASVLTWKRSMTELGSTLRFREAAKIYLVGQLGKYLPGSLWALLVQMELSRKAGVPRFRGLTASVVAIGINVGTGLAVGLLVIPSVAHGELWRYLALAALLGICIAGLTPPVLTRGVDLLMRVCKRPCLDRAISWRGIVVGTGWSFGSWLAYGLSLWVLATAAGAPLWHSLPLSLAGLALAMTAGFLVVVAPSGIGVREAVVVAALAPVLSARPALAVALLLHLVFTVADLLSAAVAALVRFAD
jgi:glycosyltransferase 2 family protein